MINILPTEIIMMVIHAMEIRSIAIFKNINRYSREIADTVPKFRAVKAQAPFIHRTATNISFIHCAAIKISFVQ